MRTRDNNNSYFLKAKTKLVIPCIRVKEEAKNVMF